jgi:hypothetical protein
VLTIAAAYVREALTFASDGTMRYSAPEGATGIRWPLRLRLGLGGVLGRLYHSLGLPFELTPLISIPFALLGGYFILVGNLWAAVLCSIAVMINDLADGIATGWAIEHLPDKARPKKKMALRRYLDTFVVDPIARMTLYSAFAIRLAQEGVVAVPWLVVLIAVELANLRIGTRTEVTNRKDTFFYEFILRKEAKARYKPYSLRVFVSHLGSYHCYSLLPVLGYALPLADHGPSFFIAVLTARTLVLGYQLKR